MGFSSSMLEPLQRMSTLKIVSDPGMMLRIKSLYIKR